MRPTTQCKNQDFSAGCVFVFVHEPSLWVLSLQGADVLGAEFARCRVCKVPRFTGAKFARCRSDRYPAEHTVTKKFFDLLMKALRKITVNLYFKAIGHFR